MRRARTILLGLAFASSTFVFTQADEGTTRVALSSPAETSRDRLPIKRPYAGGSATRGAHSGSRWFSTMGIVAVLAVLGGGGLAAKRWKLLPGVESGPVEILGRTHLTPKHAVYVVRAGGRTLLIGTGPQGAPSLLSELPDSAGTRLAPLDTRGETR